jgi:hypothetical protein
MIYTAMPCVHLASSVSLCEFLGKIDLTKPIVVSKKMLYIIIMKRLFIFIYLFSLSILCFAQNTGIKVTGRIPDTTDNRLYQIQVGAYRIIQNAENSFEKLRRASLNPSYEKYMDLTRVLIRGIKASDIPAYIERIKRAGFGEAYIKTDIGGVVTARLPASTATQPSRTLHEIGYRSVKVGEAKSLADIVTDKNVTSWISSTSSTVNVDSKGVITGLNIGNGYIIINETEYISVAVVPAENFYLLPESQTAFLPQNSRTSAPSTESITEYRTEPTFRLAYRFNNKGEKKGASGSNGGIDILARGTNYEWLWTTYRQGGWFYDLNGIKHEMINGFQKDTDNGVELTVKPEFVYENGIPYLQLRNILYNPGNITVTEQRFGASADVMIHKNDYAPLLHTSYGAYMTDSETDPSLELMFVCESGDGINPVDTLWLGMYENGMHLIYIYDDDRLEIWDADSAICFSYQNIDLAPRQKKEFIVRFTLARIEN